MQRILFIALLALTFIISQQKVYHVVAMISQGARYHVNSLYDGGEFKDKWGQITPVGFRQHETLGKLFRKLYIEDGQLLSAGYNKNEVTSYTTTGGSTIQSAMASIYGMYQLGKGQKLEPAEKKYRIPPYSYNSDVDENVFALPKGELIKTISYSSALVEDCPNQVKEMQKNIQQQLAAYNQMMLTYTPFLKKIASTFKIDQSAMNFSKLCSLYDTIRVDKYLGRPLPEEFTKEDEQNIEHLYYWYNHLITSFDLSRAFSTFTLNQVIGNFNRKVKDPSSDNKWVTISTFSGDLVSVMNNLKISSATCIEQLYRKGSTSALNCDGSTPFASNILFELHSDNQKDFYVKVRKNGKYMNLCDQKQTQCDYNTFKAQLKSIVLQDPQGFCGHSSSSQTKYAQTQ